MKENFIVFFNIGTFIENTLNLIPIVQLSCQYSICAFRYLDYNTALPVQLSLPLAHLKEKYQ